MTEESTPPQGSEEPVMSMGSSIVRSVIGLGLFAVLTAGIIALTQVLTADKIDEQIKIARSKALYEIVPEQSHDNNMLQEAFRLSAAELGLDKNEEAFIAKLGDMPVALILPVTAPQGYSGPIRLIVGIDTLGTIKGVRVVEHKETPGLGDKIEHQKSNWIDNFVGKSLANTSDDNWKVKKDGGDFDQLTGATITPRAIVNAIHDALKYYGEHGDTLLEQSPGSVYQATN